MLSICPNLLPTIPPPDGQLKVALIGEAPGADEITLGEPFVGKAGQELDRWIRPYFIRGQCFIGNLAQERPPDNKLDNWFVDPRNTIPNEKLAAWIDVLRVQLESLRPNIILALGRHPTYILTGRDHILKQWGSVLPCTLVPDLKVIALPHPSFVMRGMWDLRPVVNVWMKRARYQSTFPEYKPPVYDLMVNPNLEEVYFHLDRLMGAKELAFDIETIPNTPIPYERWLRPDIKLIYTPDILTCISFSDSPDWAISIPFSHCGGRHRWALDVEKEIWVRISRLLGQEGPLKIAHNLMFDFLQLAGRGVFVAPPYYDTMAAHNKAYLDFTKKKLKKLQLNRLAFCTALYTEQPFYKDDHKDENKGDDWKGADIEFWKYNATDSVVLHQIREATARDLKEIGGYELFKRDMKVFQPLACMSMQGVLRDVEGVQELRNELRNEEGTGLIQLLQDELDKAVGYSININSPLQLKKLLYTELNLPIQFNSKTKKPTTDEGAIAKLYQKTKNPLLKSITELIRLDTFEQNSLGDIIGLDNRTRTTYNQAKTSTSRISSSDAILGKGKNNQTVPSRTRPGEDIYNRMINDLKKTYLPDPGYLMWKRDYSQAEARVVDYLAENLEAIEDYRNGIDKHCKTTAIIYDTDYKVVYEGYKNGDPEWKQRRNVGKPTKHGFNYKLGENRLSMELAKAGVDIPPRLCKKFLQALAAADPAILRWHEEVEYILRTTRVITNAWGRPRTFMGFVDDDTVREAIAYGPQSTVGDLTNFALERVYNDPGLMDDTDLLLQQHDAFLGQSPEDVVKERTDRVGELMEIPLMIKGRELIIPSDLEVGRSWGELKKWKS